MLLILFAMAFVIGPALFLVLARRDGRRWPLAIAAAVLVIFSLVLRRSANLSLEVSAIPLFSSIFLIWIAWILVLVLVTRAIRQTTPSPAIQRWSRAIGAMGTTVPWFGFATAQMMAE